MRPPVSLAVHLRRSLRASGLRLRSGDVIVIAQKVISKTEGRQVSLPTIRPSSLARRWAVRWGRDPQLVVLALRENRRILRLEAGRLITETAQGISRPCGRGYLEQGGGHKPRCCYLATAGVLRFVCALRCWASKRSR